MALRVRGLRKTFCKAIAASQRACERIPVQFVPRVAQTCVGMRVATLQWLAECILILHARCSAIWCRVRGVSD
eukprot:7149616-Lingulodinium_polyedra.AAC.1